MPKLYTIGHSTHSLEEFLTLLEHYEITQLVDVRSIPASRRVPWFNQMALKASLKKHKIKYISMKTLGGFRKTSAASINKGWSNHHFRGFADYMQTPAFFKALKVLNALLKKGQRVAIMCAEALPWRCHRNLISDAEIIRGISVYHILSKTTLNAHQLTAFAQVDKSKRPIKLFYPDAQSSFFDNQKE